LKFSPIDGRNDPSDPSQTLFGQGFSGVKTEPLQSFPPKSLVIVGVLRGQTVSFRCREKGWGGVKPADGGRMGGGGLNHHSPEANQKNAVP